MSRENHYSDHKSPYDRGGEVKGHRFGSWTVGMAVKMPSGRTKYLCRCVCGEQQLKSRTQLNRLKAGPCECSLGDRKIRANLLGGGRLDLGRPRPDLWSRAPRQRMYSAERLRELNERRRGRG